MTSLLVSKTVACHKRSSASSLCSRHREGQGKGRKETREDDWEEKVELPCLFPFTFFSLSPSSSPFCTCHASYWNTEESLPVMVISWDLEANTILLVPRLAVVPLNPRVDRNGRLRLGSRLLRDLYKLPHPRYPVLHQIFSYSPPTGKEIQSDPLGMPGHTGQGLNIDCCITVELIQASNIQQGSLCVETYTDSSIE